jgi:uncharacterized protein (DUF1778 family)
MDAGALDSRGHAHHVCPDISRLEGDVTKAYLMDSETLGQELARESRSERMEQRVKPTMKQAIEFAAALSGTDTSEFVSMAAFQAAMDRIISMRRTRLIGDDAGRLFAALDRKAKPNEAMRKLMAEHADRMEDGE